MAGLFSAAVDWWLAGGIGSGDVVFAYQPKGASSSANALLNVNDPGTSDAFGGVAPSWATGTGWTFNGSTQYLETGFTPASSGLQSMIIRVDGLGGGANQYTGGQGTSATQFYIALKAGGSHRYANGFVRIVSTVISSGVACVAGGQGYLNGSTDGASFTPAHAGVPVPIFVGCTNNNGTAALFVDGDVIAAAVYSISLTSGEVAAVSAAMAAI